MLPDTHIFSIRKVIVFMSSITFRFVYIVHVQTAQNTFHWYHTTHFFLLFGLFVCLFDSLCATTNKYKQNKTQNLQRERGKKKTESLAFLQYKY